MSVIRTPDQRLRVFVSSTLKELRDERRVVRAQLERLHLSPVMFELGARPHPPRELYRAYIEQSHVFVGIYWQSYGWLAPGAELSGLEEELELSGDRPRLIYIREPAPEREPRLEQMLARVRADEGISYKRYTDDDELAALVAGDLAVLLAERFEAASGRHAPPASAHSPPPTPLTSTVGRDREIAEIAGILRDGARLVTLTGPGGVGKTRLAVEAAAVAAAEYPNGAEFVPLAQIADSALVPYAIADRLGATPEGAGGALEAIADLFGRRPALLVLDNLEQVVAAAPDLASLLERCPGMQILATSRQALRVRGEHEVSVAPLERGPAAELFADRARGVGAIVASEGEEAAAADELCQRLDGLPLAIELAAARCRLLSPRSLLDRLGARLDGLGAGAADLPERQRTLRATIDWSYDLLDERERELLARLGVFAGGASVEAVEEICGCGEGGDVLEGIASLLDKSLLAVRADLGGGGPRLQMLETVRIYALERLEERGEADTIRARHLDWYRRLAERAQPALCGPGQQEWAEKLDAERANLRAAVETALEGGDDASVIELVWDVVVLYYIRDAVHEPESWLQRSEDAGRPLDELLTAKLGCMLAMMRIRRGEYGGARASLESSLAVFRAAGMEFEAAVALKEVAWVRYLLDEDAAAAIDSLDEAAGLFAAVEHDWGVALTQIQLGSVLAAGGDLAGAEAAFTTALERSRRIDNGPLIGQSLQSVALVRLLEGRPPEAIEALREAIVRLRAGRHQIEASYCLDGLAALALHSGDGERAARSLAAATAVRERLGVRPWPSYQGFLSSLARSVRELTGVERMDEISASIGDVDVFAALDEALELVHA